MGVRVHDAGCDPLALRVDGDIALGDLETLADRLDLPLAEENRCILDACAGAGQDGGANQGRRTSGKGLVG